MSDKDNTTATVLGTIGTVLWCVQLIPQIIRNYIVKDATGVPATMMFLWAASGVPFGIYFVTENSNTALQIQPQLFTFFCLISLGQVLYYPPVSLGLRKSVLFVVIQGIVSAGLELAAALPLRPVYARGTTWPNLIFGVIAAVLLAVGLLPPYFELWKRQGRVVGINFIFLTMDSLGAVFSMASVIQQGGKLDILGLVLYCIVLCLELGIFVSHGIWKIRTVFFGLEVPDLQEEDKEAVQETNDEEKQSTLSSPSSPSNVSGAKSSSENIIMSEH